MEENGPSKINLQQIVLAIGASDAQKVGVAIKEHGEHWKAHTNPDILNRQILFEILHQLTILNGLVSKSMHKPDIVVPGR